MSRAIIISVLVVLILGVLGGTAVLITRRLASTASVDDASSSPAIATALLPNPSGDEDSDGLSNGDELRWRTNLYHPDTDGDGFKDGEEVRSRHNPTIAGPQDIVPEGFVPGQDVEPGPIASNPAAVLPSLTQHYQQLYGKQATTETMRAFVASVPITTDLPIAPAGSLTPAESDSPDSRRVFLATIQKVTTAFDLLQFETDILNLYLSGDPIAIRQTAQRLRAYQRELVITPTPKSGVEVQRMVWGYTERMAKTLESLARSWQEDKVQALVLQRTVEALFNYYDPRLKSDISRWQQGAGI